MSAVAEKKPRDKLAGWIETCRRDGRPSEYQLSIPRVVNLSIWLDRAGMWQLTANFHPTVGELTGRTIDRCKQQAISLAKQHLVTMLTDLTWTTIGSDNGHDD